MTPEQINNLLLFVVTVLLVVSGYILWFMAPRRKS